MSRLRVAIVTECALSRKHGTGAQLLQLVDGAPFDFFHLYLTGEYAGLSECANSFRLEDPRYRGRGKRFVAPLERALGINWWNGDRIQPQKLRGLISRHRLSCDVAYVLVGSEQQAARAGSILGVLDCPYVLHVMDIYHGDGLSREATPAFARLAENAASLIAISEPIAAELKKFRPGAVEIMPIVHRATEVRATHAANGTVRVLLMGKPYARGTELLAAAWDGISQRIPGIELAYVGQQAHGLPPGLQRIVRDLGYVSEAGELERLLSGCHLAFLPGPSEPDHFTRFSIPSRISDYLMAGLPIVATVGAGSATERFLGPLIPASVAAVSSPEQIVAAMEHFAGNPEHWLAASAAARKFAVEHLSVGAIRERLFDILTQAAAGH